MDIVMLSPPRSDNGQSIDRRHDPHFKSHWYTDDAERNTVLI